MPTSDETVRTRAEDLAAAMHQAEEEDADQQIAYILAEQEKERERAKQKEQERSQRRSTLRRQLETRATFIIALLERLTESDVTMEEHALIARLLRREMIGGLDLVEDYKAAGGDRWDLGDALFSRYLDD